MRRQEKKNVPNYIWPIFEVSILAYIFGFSPILQKSTKFIYIILFFYVNVNTFEAILWEFGDRSHFPILLQISFCHSY